jgi:acyl carrier protein
MEEEEEDPLKADVLRLVAAQYKTDPAAMTLASRFDIDMVGDSIDFIELLLTIERRLHAQIPDEDAAKLHTIGELLEQVRRYQKKSLP